MTKRAHRSTARGASRTAISSEIPKVSGARLDEALEHEVIADAARIRRTLWRLFADEASGVLRAAGSPYPYRALRLARVQPGRELPLSFDVAGGAPGGDVEIRLFGPGSVYRFSPGVCRPSAGLFATDMPHVLVRERHRGGRRVRVDGLQLSFPHPGQPHVRVVREIVDVSLTGVAVRIGRFDGLASGQPIAAVVDWQERGRIRVRGTVRHVSPEVDGTGEIAGIELVVDDDEDGLRWRRHVEAALWPHTIADGSYAQDVWECLIDSGYCNLSAKSASDFEDLRQAFVGATHALAASPDLGAQLVIPSGRGVEATLSTLRIYERSHFLYAVAKQPGRTPRWTNGRRILRDLYVHAIERLAPDPQAKWLIVWVQVQAEFTRFVHDELATRYADADRSMVFRVDVMEAQRARPEPIPEHVSLADAEETEHVLAQLATVRSRIYLDAHDLVPERFELADLRASWARVGLVRERALLVAREGDETVAAATVELASEGLHLFRLFDTVRTYALRPGGERHVPALLAAARRFFEDRRKPTFIYVREDLDTPPPQGFRSLALTDVTIFPSSLYPELLEHVHDLTASPEAPIPR